MMWVKNHGSSVWHLNVGDHLAPCGKRIQGAGQQGTSKKYCRVCRGYLKAIEDGAVK